MSRYENYKDTGLIWQKKIPYNWEVVRLKKIATFNTGNSIKDEEKAKYAKQDESRLYISTSDIDGNHMKINHKSNIYIPLKSKSFKIASKGSTLVCIEGGNGGKKAALVTEDVNFGNKLCAIKTYEEDDNYIYWLDINSKRTNVVLTATPLNIAKKLSSVLFDNLNRLVFASATIVANGNFDYFKKSLGLDEEDCIEAIIKSPFDYNEQMSEKHAPYIHHPTFQLLLQCALYHLDSNRTIRQ